MRKGITVDEAAQKLCRSTKTIVRYIATGKLSAEKIDGRWRINLPDDVIEQAAEESLDVPNIQAQLAAMAAERDWLRALVDELTTINKGLVAALQGKQGGA